MILCRVPHLAEDNPVPTRGGTAQVRRGRAVFKVSYEAGGIYANDDLEKDVVRVLNLLSDRAAAFDLGPAGK
jgi:hypothetical protein